MCRHVSQQTLEAGHGGKVGRGLLECEGAGGGTKTNEKVRSVAGVRDGECLGGAVVGDREAKKLGGDGVGLGVVKGR
jgi:hypothetical protein